MLRRTRRHSLTAVAAAAALALALAACSSTESSPASNDSTVDATSTAGPHNEADTQFAQAMIVHHQGAIEMAELAAQDATTPEVRELAEAISQAQGPEIELMTGWLQAWGESTGSTMPGTEHDGMDMGGMTMDGLSQEEAMGELGEVDGADLDRRFLELMIAHHEGAVVMAE
ncbi:MAG: DUF305 domain-containing protein, partial [Cellulomonadaceae bacterium]|nr:DUF305 domain-containing protein [Cellulomonadaceae bacterium]